VIGWPILAVFCVISGLLAAGELHADDKYYLGGVETSVFTNDYDGGGTGLSCSNAGCHTAGEVACDGSGSSTNYLSYNGVYNCIGEIQSRITSGSMPQSQSAGYTAGVKAGFLASLTTWTNNGYAKQAPTASTTSSSYLSQTSRRLTGSFNPNTSGGGGTYGFRYGTTSPPPAALTSTPTITGTTSVSRTRDITGLVCGQPYYYRARVTNGLNAGAVTVLGASILNFTITCTAPVITGSTATINMSEDGSPTAFVAPNLSVSDSDAGTLNWSVSSQPVIQGTATPAGGATATGSGNGESISYTPPLNFVGIVEFTVRVTNATTTLFDDHTITVNVNAVNDPPEITEGAGPLVLTATNEDTAGDHAYVERHGPGVGRDNLDCREWPESRYGNLPGRHR
jgi:hypothetical protein